jgi:hypothetical protein
MRFGGWWPSSVGWLSWVCWPLRPTFTCGKVQVIGGTSMRHVERWLPYVVFVGIALAQTVSPLGSAIGDAVDSVSSDIIPKMLIFMGLLVSVSLGWAIVRVIRG